MSLLRCGNQPPGTPRRGGAARLAGEPAAAVCCNCCSATVTGAALASVVLLLLLLLLWLGCWRASKSGLLCCCGPATCPAAAFRALVVKPLTHSSAHIVSACCCNGPWLSASGSWPLLLLLLMVVLACCRPADASPAVPLALGLFPSCLSPACPNPAAAAAAAGVCPDAAVTANTRSCAVLGLAALLEHQGSARCCCSRDGTDASTLCSPAHVAATCKSCTVHMTHTCWLLARPRRNPESGVLQASLRGLITLASLWVHFDMGRLGMA